MELDDELDELVEAAGSFLPESLEDFEDDDVVDDELDERLSVR